MASQNNRALPHFQNQQFYMKGKKLVRLLSPEVELPSSGSSNNLHYKNIISNFKSNNSSRPQGMGRSSDVPDPQKQPTNKTSGHTHYRCGCCALQAQMNHSIQFGLGSPKAKPKNPSRQLMYNKSADMFSRLRANKSTEPQLAANKLPIQTSPHEKSSKMIKRVKLADEQSQLKKVLKKITALKNEYEELLVSGKNDRSGASNKSGGHNRSGRSDRGSRDKLKEKDRSTELIKYVPKENVKTVERVRLVEKPVEKIVYSIKKVPREVITYKDVVVEVPVIKEQLVFVDPEPQTPIIKYVPVVNYVEKVVDKENPDNQRMRTEFAVAEKENQELESLIKDSLKEIQSLRGFIETQKHHQKELARIRSAQDLFIQTLKKQTPEPKSETSLGANVKTLQKPRVLSIETQDTQKPLLPAPSPIVSMSSQNLLNRKPNESIGGTSMHSPKIMRITSEGRMVNGGQLMTGFSSSENVIRISAETRPMVIERTPTVQQTSKIGRKYCKKNCGDVCNCMADMMIITTQKN